MTFQKGKSGNPGGRRRAPLAERIVLAEIGPKSLKFLADLVENQEVHLGPRVRAATTILHKWLPDAQPQQSGDVAAALAKLAESIAGARARDDADDEDDP